MFALFRNRPTHGSRAAQVKSNMPGNLRWVVQLSAGLRFRFGFFAAEYSKKYLARTGASEIIEP